MTKLQFLFALKEKLSALPPEEAEERLNFYAEMIEDRMEEGLSEEEAVAAVGAVEDIAGDVPPAKTEKPRQPLKTGTILLLVLGAPLWVPLLIAAAAVALSLYVCLWALIVCFWAAFAATAGCALGGIVSGITLLCLGNLLGGITLLGGAIACAGAAITTFLGSRTATITVAMLTSKYLRKLFKKEGHR